MIIVKGTHWLWEIITMVVRKQAEVSPMFKEDYFLEMKPFDQLLKTSPYPIVYTTQFPPSQLPKSISNLKRVTILRNPKDVMVSTNLVNHENLTFKSTCN